jgi:hypothetical protein
VVDGTDKDEAPDTPASPTASRDTDRDITPITTSRPPLSESEAEASGEQRATGNTLLSVGSAAQSAEPWDPKVDELERRIEQLEARLKVLELGRGLGSDRRWMFWVGLLLALALGWQLRAFFASSGGP